LQWLFGLAPISHRTLSGFRSECKGALDDRFVQVLGMMSAEGLITLERVTLDGTKINANVGGNTLRRKQKLEAHLELAREQVRVLNAQAEEAEKTAKRQAAARRRVARQRASRLEAAVREVERLQEEKKHDRKQFVARASSTDPDAHVMRNGEGGTVPSYNVQLLTDSRHGIVVNVEASIDAIDYRQLGPAIERCETMLGRKPIVADGDYTNHLSVQAAAAGGVDFYGSWQDSWKPMDRDAQGRRAAFLASAFPYDARRDCFTLSRRTDPVASGSAESRERGPHSPLSRAEAGLPPLRCSGNAPRSQRGPNGGGRLPASKNRQQRWPNQDEDRRGATNLCSALADRRVPPRLDQGGLRLATVSLPWPAEGSDGSHLGMPQLQPHKVVQHKTQVEPESCVSTSLTMQAKNLSQRFQQ
jgi:hypothetical protein